MRVVCDYFFHQYIRVSAKSNSGLELESLIQIESIYKLEIINLIKSGNWSTNSCNRSTNFLQVLAVTKALLWAARWPRWRRFDQSPGKYCTIKKNTLSSKGTALWAGFASKLILVVLGWEQSRLQSCWVPRAMLPPHSSISLRRVWCCSFANCIPFPVKSNGEILKQPAKLPLLWPLRHLERTSRAPTSPSMLAEVPASPPQLYTW